MRRHRDYKKLAISVAVDLIGVLPQVAGVGLAPATGGLSFLFIEAVDVAWAPVSALIIQALYGREALTALALGEEFLPGSDIIPTATLGWYLYG